MVSVMHVCPHCGQRATVEVSPGKDAGASEVPCTVCGAATVPVQRVCECGKELNSHGSRG